MDITGKNDVAGEACVTRLCFSKITFFFTSCVRPARVGPFGALCPFPFVI